MANTHALILAAGEPLVVGDPVQPCPRGNRATSSASTPALTAVRPGTCDRRYEKCSYYIPTMAAAAGDDDNLRG
jgi:hypothetical protein